MYLYRIMKTLNIQLFWIILLGLLLGATSLLEAQKRVIISAMGQDVQYRISRAEVHAPSAETHRNIDTGEDLINHLKGDPIDFWVFFSHGNDSRMFGKNPKKRTTNYSSGLTLTSLAEDRQFYPKARTLADLEAAIKDGSIQFADDAIIYLGACAVAAANPNTNEIFAQELANVTGATVIAGEHQTEPQVENYQELIYTNIHHFMEFRPNQAPKLLGPRFHLTKMMDVYRKTGKLHYEFESEHLKEAVNRTPTGSPTLNTPQASEREENQDRNAVEEAKKKMEEVKENVEEKMEKILPKKEEEPTDN